MKLYHGTNERAARAILRDGLKPRAALPGVPTEGNWLATVPSNPEAVYLTTAYAPFFATVATGEDERMAFIEVDTELLDASLFRPDEDFLEQATRGQTGRPPFAPPRRAGLVKRVAWFRDHIHAWSGQEAWRLSLEHLGTCAYYGGIPREAISRVALCAWDAAKDMSMLAADPMICIPNYKFCGVKYRALTRWFMGYPVTAADLFLGELGPEAAEHLFPLEVREGWERAAADQSMIEVIAPSFHTDTK